VFDYPTSRDIGEFIATTHPSVFATIAPAAATAQGATLTVPAQLPAPLQPSAAAEAVFVMSAAYRVAGGSLDRPASGGEASVKGNQGYQGMRLQHSTI